MKRNVLAIIALVVLLLVVTVWNNFNADQASFDATRQLLAHNVCVSEIRKHNGSTVDVYLETVELPAPNTWHYVGTWQPERLRGDEHDVICTVTYADWRSGTPHVELR